MSLRLGDTTIAGSTIQLGKPLNIGQIVESIIPLTDAGLHLLDGSLINGSGIYSAFVDYIAGLVTDYPNLFTTEAAWQTSVTTYGNCGKFVYNSTNNTVRLPKITRILQGASDVSELGNRVEAGLPNITQSNLNLFTYSINDGFIKNTTQGTFPAAGGGGYSGQGITTFTVDASRSNSIYGNSNTVQPQSVKVLYYIVIATNTKTEIEVDIDEIATDLNGKADVDLTNTVPTSNFATALNTAGIRTVVETYVNGTSWYRVYSDGWCEQGGVTAATIDGEDLTISLLKPFVNTNYSITSQLIDYASTTAITFSRWRVWDITTSSFKILASDAWQKYWMACGYIS